MTEQQGKGKADESEQDRRRERRVKWATVFAMTIDAASKVAEIIIRR
jgi:hypothetical protein